MSKYARKLEKMESGKWFMKSVVLLGSGILCMVLLELLGALGSAVGVDFLEAMAETLSEGVFLVYLVGVLAIYTVTGTWGYILHLFKEAFLLPWKFTPVIVLAWMFTRISSLPRLALHTLVLLLPSTYKRNSLLLILI